MYNPRLPRFMQPDPIGYDGGMNPYPYVGGDPVNRTDPMGLRKESLPWHINYRADPPNSDIVVTGTRNGCAGLRFCSSVTGLFAIQDLINSLAAPIQFAAAEHGGEGIGGGEQDSQCRARFVPIALVSEGDTIGGSPEKRGRRYVTDVRGGYREALALFTAISRLNGQTYVDTAGLGDMFTSAPWDVTLGVSLNPTTGARGAVRLRYGADHRNPGYGQFKVDVAKGANPNLNAAETVHFRKSSKNRSPICPS